MADIVKTTGYNTPCLLQNGNYCDWINAAFKFELSKTSDGQKYNCKVWVSLYTSENMNWSGDGTMNLTARWYDKRTQSWETFSDSKETSTPLYTSYGGTDWSGGLSFQFAAYTDEIEFTVDNDLLRTICDNHHMAVGPDYVSAGTHFQHFILNGYRINVQSLPLLTAPQISGSLTNTTPYRNPVDGKTYYNISAYETSVGLKYTKSGGDDEDGYRHWHNGQSEPSSWLGDPANNTYTESGLSAGTNYTCYCRIHNGAGQSGIASWSGRTLHKIPVVTLTHSHSTQAGLEDLDISWSCDKNVACIYYRVKGESNWRIGAGARNASSDIGKSGIIHISQTEATVEGSKDLYENTDYTIEVKVLSTVAYDSRESSVKSIACKTDKRAALTSASSRNITVGAVLRVLKENESGNKNDIFFATRPYDNSSAYADWCNRNLADNDETITFTQTEWDNVYRRFLNPSNASKNLTEHNNIRVRFTLRTYGRTRHYDSTYEGLIILTGDMMTTRTNVRGALKRGKVWCRPDGTIHRGVAWVTSSRGVWRRGI